MCMQETAGFGYFDNVTCVGSYNVPQEGVVTYTSQIVSHALYTSGNYYDYREYFITPKYNCYCEVTVSVPKNGILQNTVAFAFEGTAPSDATQYRVRYGSTDVFNIHNLEAGKTYKFVGWHEPGINMVMGSTKVETSYSITFKIQAYSLSIDPASKSVGSGVSSNNISVISNTAWSVSTKASWLTLNKMSGSGKGSITFTAAANTSTSSRTGKITFAADGCESQECTITQSGVSPTLSIDPASKSVGSGASSNNISVISNTAWSVSTKASWLTLGKKSGEGDGSVTFTAVANTSASSRTGKITFTATTVTGLSKECTVTQSGAAPSLSVSSKTMSVAAAASAGNSIAVTSNTSWSVTTDAPWLTLGKKSGEGDGSVTFSIEANTSTSSRTGNITFTADGCPSQLCKVTQYGVTPTLSISLSKNSFDASASSNNIISIKSNTSWKVTTDEDWLTFGKEAGEGDGSVTFNVEANTSMSARKGQIKVSVTNRTNMCTVTQSGAAPSLSVSPTTKSVAAAASAGNSIKVTSNTLWSVTTDAPWLTLGKKSGEGDGSVTFSIEANTSMSSRTGKITFTADGCDAKLCTVTQSGAAPSLSVSPTTKSVAAAASAGNSIKVTSNTSWTVSTKSSWLTLGKMSGSGSTSVTFSVSENTSTSPRTGTITFTADGCDAKVCTVTQSGAAPSLSIDLATKSVAASASAGNSIAVTSNTSWNVSADASWLTIGKASGSGSGSVTFGVSANTSTSPRTGTITFTADGCDAKLCTVTQSGIAPSLSISPTTKSVAAAVSTNTISVTSNTSWTIVSSASWLKVIRKSNENARRISRFGNGSVTFSVSENTSTSPRTGTITFTADGCESQLCTVTQSGTEINDNLAEAVDNESLAWTTGGDANWFGQAETTYDGSDAAQSGAIANNQSSYMQTIVSGSGTIYFYWKVSSEEKNDTLAFSIDGVNVETIAGSSEDWNLVSKAVAGTGTHTLKWSYDKNGSQSFGSDCGWVDKITWSPDQLINLNTGWNWVSFQMLPASHKVGDVLGTARFTANDVIQSSSGSSRFNGTSWIPSSFTIDYGRLYMINVSNPISVTMTGTESGTSSLSVTAGWNWIANPTTTSITPSQLKHSVGWTAGDRIQAPNGSVTYTGSKWVPSTGFLLEPGMGYQILSAKSGTITF